MIKHQQLNSRAAFKGRAGSVSAAACVFRLLQLGSMSAVPNPGPGGATILRVLVVPCASSLSITHSFESGVSKQRSVETCSTVAHQGQDWATL